MNKLLLVLAAIVAASFIANYLLAYAFGRGYRIFVAPGVIVHELAHAFFCFLTGAKIQKISLFEKDGGSVKHGKSKVPIFGSILISVAPMLIGLLFIYIISYLFIFRDPVSLDISSAALAINSVQEMIASLDLSSLKLWIAFYVVLSIAVTMTPSVQDFKNIFISVVILSGMVWLVKTYTSFDFIFFASSSDLIYLPLLLVASTLIITLGLSIIIYTVASVIKLFI